MENGYYVFISKDLKNLTCKILIGEGFTQTGKEQLLTIKLHNGLIKLIIDGHETENKIRDVTETIRNAGSDEEYFDIQIDDFFGTLMKSMGVDNSLIFESNNDE